MSHACLSAPESTATAAAAAATRSKQRTVRLAAAPKEIVAAGNASRDVTELQPHVLILVEVDREGTVSHEEGVSCEGPLFSQDQRNLHSDGGGHDWGPTLHCGQALQADQSPLDGQEALLGGELEQVVYVSEEVEVETENNLDTIHLLADRSGEEKVEANATGVPYHLGNIGSETSQEEPFVQYGLPPRRIGVIQEKAVYLRQLQEEEAAHRLQQQQNSSLEQLAVQDLAPARQPAMRSEAIESVGAPRMVRPDVKSIIERYTKRHDRKRSLRGKETKAETSADIQPPVTANRPGITLAENNDNSVGELKGEAVGMVVIVSPERCGERNGGKPGSRKDAEGHQTSQTATGSASWVPSPKKTQTVIPLKYVEGVNAADMAECTATLASSRENSTAADVATEYASQTSAAAVLMCPECGKSFAKKSSLLFHKGTAL